MLQVQLDPALERTLASIAARTGDAPADLARQALLAYLEDLEDYATAVEGWKAHDPANTISAEEMLRELGLEAKSGRAARQSRDVGRRLSDAGRPRLIRSNLASLNSSPAGLSYNPASRIYGSPSVPLGGPQ